MTARVSFAGRARAAAVAVAWIVALALVGGGASWTVEQLRLNPDPSWWLAWGALTAAAGFGLATWVVGRVLDRRSWEELGWRPRIGVPRSLALGVGLGAVMAALAVGLAVAAGHAAVTTHPGAAGRGAPAPPPRAGVLLAPPPPGRPFPRAPLRPLPPPPPPPPPR